MFYVEKDNKIVLFDENKDTLENTIDFMPDCEWAKIKETQEGYTIVDFELITVEQEEQQEQQKERERLNALNLTKADFWIALLDRDITKSMVKDKIELIPDEKLKAKTLIRLDEADHFWRGDPSMDVIGAMFGITSADLDYLFENKALPVVDVEAE